MFAVPPDRAETPLILAIDIGTSSVRASLFDRLGRTVEGSESRQSHEIHTTVNGAAETDPEGLLEIVCGVLDGALTKAGRLIHGIGGVATCTFVSNVLGIDKAGRPLTSLATYADTRAEGEVTALRREFDETEIHDRTGCHFHPCYLPAFLRWFARNDPDRFRKITRWISIGEYLELKLFGETAASYSAASWTGLLNRNALQWDRPLLTALQVQPEQLSPLVDANLPRRSLLPQFAKRWPALSEIPWFPTIADGAAANIGSGCVSPARVALTIGTTSAVRAVITSSLDHIPYGLWCYRVDGRRSLIGGALNEGGNIFAWIRNTLKLGDSSGLEPTLARMSPDAHGLTVLPFLAGERAPGWAGRARGTVHGLSFATTPLDILRAGLEAVAYRVAIVFDLLCKVLPKDPQVVASGGALLSSPTWIQIIADVLAHPISISEVQEASSRGAVLLALESMGILRNLREAPHFIGRIYEPDMNRHTRYREAMQRQILLYDKLIK